MRERSPARATAGPTGFPRKTARGVRRGYEVQPQRAVPVLLRYEWPGDLVARRRPLAASTQLAARSDRALLCGSPSPTPIEHPLPPDEAGGAMHAPRGLHTFADVQSSVEVQPVLHVPA